MLQIAVRVFLTIIVPLYGGYVGLSLNVFDVYVLVVAAWSLWAYGQPGPQELWQTGGVIGVLKGWLLMAVAVVLVGGPAFALGYYVLRTPAPL